MITDSTFFLKRYSAIAPEAFASLIDILPELDADTPLGRQEIIEGKLFIIIQKYDTHTPDIEKLEIHEDFIDLQMLLSGEEVIYSASVDYLPCVTAYDAAKDCAFYHADAEELYPVKLNPGKFAIFFPGEGHLPGCGDGSSVIKAVVKIHRTLFR